jgi:hypothetical protein
MPSDRPSLILIIKNSITTTIAYKYYDVGSKLKWSSASSSDQCRSKNERSSTSGKTMMEEVVEVAGFRSLPKYRIADGPLSVGFWDGLHSVLPQVLDFSQTLHGLYEVASRTPVSAKGNSLKTRAGREH